MFWLFDSIFLCALKSYAKLVQGERKSKLVCDFCEPPPNFGLSKVKQTSAECKTKNEVFGFAYAECSQTYVKLSKRVQNTKRNRRFQYRAVVSVAQVT